MKELKLLMIGNSFSEDTVRYVYEIFVCAALLIRPRHVPDKFEIGICSNRFYVIHKAI